MPLNGANLSASRWATTNRNTSTFKGHYGNHNYQTSHSSSSTLRSSSPSKVAPTQKEPEFTPEQKDFQSRTSAYHIFLRYSRRLKWKSTALLHSHQRTLSLIHNTNAIPSNHIGGIDFPMQPEEAETMFKIDFFEFYTILENTLVNLLKVFGTIVSPIFGTDAQTINGDGLRQTSTTDNINNNNNAQQPKQSQRDSLIGDSKAILKSHHSYHANVLLAIDKDTCPLKDIMGQEPVRSYLGIAKEWRNKWKNIEDEGKDERTDGLIGSRYERLINDLNLEEMLREILIAVERGGNLADQVLKYMGEELYGGGNGVLASASMDVDYQQAANDLVEMLPGDIMEWD